MDLPYKKITIEKEAARRRLLRIVERCLPEYVINRELRFKAEQARLPPAARSAHGFPLADRDDGPDALEMCTKLPLAVYS